MAYGLHFLGRGRTRASAVHLGGAICGGGVFGLAIGWTGSVLSLNDVRYWIVVPVGLVAIKLSWQRRPVTLGLQCQVPRSWTRTMPPGRRFFLWGCLLGCGTATVIPYSAILVFFSALPTAGPRAALLAGMTFGFVREGVAVLQAPARHGEAILDRFAAHFSTMRIANRFVAGASLLILVALPTL